MAPIMPVMCFISPQMVVTYTETSFNVIIMTLRMFVVNFIEQLYVFIIPLFGVIFKAFYQVGCAVGDPLNSTLSPYVLDGRMNDRKMS